MPAIMPPMATKYKPAVRAIPVACSTYSFPTRAHQHPLVRRSIPSICGGDMIGGPSLLPPAAAIAPYEQQQQLLRGQLPASWRLYVGGLERDSVTDETLKKNFEPYGYIISAATMIILRHDDDGVIQPPSTLVGISQQNTLCVLVPISLHSNML
eukprot:7327511-Pyramimonas_sp.AAC.3